MICIECMMDKNSNEYVVVHYLIPPEQLDSFRENPESFQGNYCVCNGCVTSKIDYPTLNSVH